MLKHTALILMLILIAPGARALTRHGEDGLALPSAEHVDALSPDGRTGRTIPRREAPPCEIHRAKSPDPVHETAPMIRTPHTGDQYPLIERRRKSSRVRPAVAATQRSRGETAGRPRYYRVRPGDTLFGVARRFGVTVDELCSANNVSRSATLTAGRRIRVPGGPRHAVAKAREESASPSARADIAGAPRFTWPVRNADGIRRDGDSGVRPIGIIIGGRSGAPVLSSARGVVEKIGTMRGFGHYVIIKHERHYLTVYSRMSGINVSEGDTVGRGRMIGTQGDELHFQINRAGRPLDPLALLPDRG